MVQEGLEVEQADFAGRAHYQRGEATATASGINRGIWTPPRGAWICPMSARTGTLSLDAVRAAQERFADARAAGRRDVCPGLVDPRPRGAAFTDGHGVCLLSRTGVSEVTEAASG